MASAADATSSETAVREEERGSTARRGGGKSARLIPPRHPQFSQIARGRGDTGAVTKTRDRLASSPHLRLQWFIGIRPHLLEPLVRRNGLIALAELLVQAPAERERSGIDGGRMINCLYGSEATRIDHREELDSPLRVAQPVEQFGTRHHAHPRRVRPPRCRRSCPTFLRRSRCPSEINGTPPPATRRWRGRRSCRMLDR